MAAVPLVDLKAQHASIRDEVMRAVGEVIDEQAFVLGERVARFERAFAKECGVAHAIGVASGSDALVLALRACGVGEGDAVVTPSFTFVATAEAICRVGARPVFADVDASMTLSPAHVAEAVEGATARGMRVRAIVPVHLFGRCADMRQLTAIARAKGLAVVEDAAQAVGARTASGVAGALGDAGCFSFFPSKNLGAWGDGGAVTARDPAIDARVRRLRQHGAEVKGEAYAEIGMNSRLDALQAAVLDVKLRYLAAWTAARGRAAARYRELLGAIGDLALPEPVTDGLHVYNQFVIRSPRRDALARHLAAAGVASRAYYPIPLHRQPCFAPFRDDAPLPETERAAATALAIPLYAEINADQQAQVADAIAAFFR